MEEDLEKIPRAHFGKVEEEDWPNYELTEEERAIVEEDSYGVEMPCSDYVRIVLGFDPDELFSEEEE